MRGFRLPLRGFTLLEVLIALTILAISSMAIIRQIGQSTSQLQQLELKTMATMIADNRIAEYRIAEKWPEQGTDSTVASMAGHQWQINTEVENTSEPWLRKLTVSVSIETDDGDSLPLTELVIYRGRY